MSQALHNSLLVYNHQQRRRWLCIQPVCTVIGLRLNFRSLFFIHIPGRSAEYFFHVMIHYVIIHRDQEGTCKNPCRRAGKTYPQITALLRCDQSNHSSSDQFCDSCRHGQKPIPQPLYTIAVNIYDRQRNKEHSYTFQINIH